jgi:hypothetical protein
VNIYQNTPYTYFLMWTSTKKKYYGCQHGKKSNPNNILSHTYKTSSRYVKQYWKNFGPPDVIIIHRVFKNSQDCLLFEHTYLKRVQAVYKEDWLNKTDNKAISTDTYSQESWKKSHESRRKHFKEDEEYKKQHTEKFVEMMTSLTAVEKRKETFSRIGHSKGSKNSRYGITIKGTPLADKISATRKTQVDLNKKNAEKLNAKKHTCEHCEKDKLSSGNYKRWHHNNCRLRK